MSLSRFVIAFLVAALTISRRTYALPAETKGLSLEEVRALFEQQVGLAPSSSSSSAAAAAGPLAHEAHERGEYHVVGEVDEAQGLMSSSHEEEEEAERGSAFRGGRLAEEQRRDDDDDGECTRGPGV